MKKLKKAWFIKTIGKDNFFSVKKDAISFVYSKLNRDVCKNCKIKAFIECNK